MAKEPISLLQRLRPQIIQARRTHVMFDSPLSLRGIVKRTGLEVNRSWCLAFRNGQETRSALLQKPRPRSSKLGRADVCQIFPLLLRPNAEDLLHGTLASIVCHESCPSRVDRFQGTYFDNKIRKRRVRKPCAEVRNGSRHLDEGLSSKFRARRHYLLRRAVDHEAKCWNPMSRRSGDKASALKFLQGKAMKRYGSPILSVSHGLDARFSYRAAMKVMGAERSARGNWTPSQKQNPRREFKQTCRFRRTGGGRWSRFRRMRSFCRKFRLRSISFSVQSQLPTRKT